MQDELSSQDLDDLLTNRRMLDEFLVGYDRITVPEACESIVGNRLDVWTNSDGQWTQMPSNDVQALVTDAKNRGLSVCRALLVDNLLLSEDAYLKAKNTLNTVAGPAGVYLKNGNSLIVFDAGV